MKLNITMMPNPTAFKSTQALIEWRVAATWESTVFSTCAACVSPRQLIRNDNPVMMPVPPALVPQTY
jgi:hypothetical protein